MGFTVDDTTGCFLGGSGFTAIVCAGRCVVVVLLLVVGGGVGRRVVVVVVVVVVLVVGGGGAGVVDVLELEWGCE